MVKKKTVVTNRGKMLELLQSSKCVDCGNSDVRVLEFDHLADKHKSLNEMLQTGYAWTSMLKEIDKCEIVCANCHKIRTYTRCKSYRNGHVTRKEPVTEGTS